MRSRGIAFLILLLLGGSALLQPLALGNECEIENPAQEIAPPLPRVLDGIQDQETTTRVSDRVSALETELDLSVKSPSDQALLLASKCFATQSADAETAKRAVESAGKAVEGLRASFMASILKPPHWELKDHALLWHSILVCSRTLPQGSQQGIRSLSQLALEALTHSTDRKALSKPGWRILLGGPGREKTGIDVPAYLQLSVLHAMRGLAEGEEKEKFNRAFESLWGELESGSGEYLPTLVVEEPAIIGLSQGISSGLQRATGIRFKSDRQHPKVHEDGSSGRQRKEAFRLWDLLAYSLVVFPDANDPNAKDRSRVILRTLAEKDQREVRDLGIRILQYAAGTRSLDERERWKEDQEALENLVTPKANTQSKLGGLASDAAYQVYVYRMAEFFRVIAPESMPEDERGLWKKDAYFASRNGGPNFQLVRVSNPVMKGTKSEWDFARKLAPDGASFKNEWGGQHSPIWRHRGLPLQEGERITYTGPVDLSSAGLALKAYLRTQPNLDRAVGYSLDQDFSIHLNEFTGSTSANTGLAFGLLGAGALMATGVDASVKYRLGEKRSPTTYHLFEGRYDDRSLWLNYTQRNHAEDRSWTQYSRWGLSSRGALRFEFGRRF